MSRSPLLALYLTLDPGLCSLFNGAWGRRRGVGLLTTPVCPLLRVSFEEPLGVCRGFGVPLSAILSPFAAIKIINSWGDFCCPQKDFEISRDNFGCQNWEQYCWHTGVTAWATYESGFWESILADSSTARGWVKHTVEASEAMTQPTKHRTAPWTSGKSASAQCQHGQGGEHVP